MMDQETQDKFMKKWLENYLEEKLEPDRIECELEFGWTFRIVEEKIEEEIIDLEVPIDPNDPNTDPRNHPMY
jgi:hypothetical protein